MASTKSRAAALAEAAEKQQTPRARKFRELTDPVVFAFETIGQQVEGELVKVKDVRIRGKRDAVIYTLRQDNGERRQVWGTAYLDQRLAEVELGTYVRITYTEDEDVGQDSPMRKFRVETA
jgi:hypothetical protein